MEKWISEIYEASKAKHKEYSLNDGMAVFYSPVIYNPKILFIGDNPGSGAGTVHTAPPKLSEYAYESYQLASMMRRIFSTPELREILENSVITNRVFFQSNGIKVFKEIGVWEEMKKWCFPFVRTIIEEINPEIIFAQSIGTYNALIKGLKGKPEEILVIANGKGLLKAGKVNDKLILGIWHPTARQRFSYEHWTRVTEKLSEIIV